MATPWIIKGNRLCGFFVSLIALLLLFFPSGCGDDHQSSSTVGTTDTASAALTIHWKTLAPNPSEAIQAAAADWDCQANGVVSVVCQVYDANGNWLQIGGPWDCTNRSGRVDGIKAGPNRSFVVLAEDVDGNVRYHGETTGVTIEAGRITQGVVVDAYPFVPALISPEEGTQVDPNAFSLEWEGLVSADQYRVVVAADETFENIVTDATTAETVFAPMGLAPSTLYHWRIYGLDIHDNQSATLEQRSFITSAITNELPRATIMAPEANATIGEGEALTFSGSAQDPEEGSLSGNALAWASDVDGPIGTGESFTIDDLSVGIHTITLTATDGQGATGRDAIDIEILSTIDCHPPALDPIGNQAVAEGQTLSFTVSAVDPDTDSQLTFSASNLPQGADFNPQTRAFTWNTNTGDADIYDVTFRVCDDCPEGALCDTEAISISVEPTPSPSPPTPNPMTWVSEPYEVSSSSITMVARTAEGANPPITYQFDFAGSPTGGTGGTDSTWQSSTTYSDAGLAANHQYGYRVRARDTNDDRTAYSPASYDYTDIETPSGITFGTITTNSIQARATNTPSGLNRGASGLIIYNLSRETDSGWKQDNNYWTSTPLSVNTRYGFRAVARNGDGNPSGNSSTAYGHTLANMPGYVQFSNATPASIQANWTANGNPSETQYYCENITAGTNSGWITGTSWNSTGLACGTRYAFRVMARNGDGEETGWRDLDDTSTAACLPVVTVTAIEAQALEGQEPEFFYPGTYRISRTGSTLAPLPVNFAMSGTAVNGQDYDSISSPVTIGSRRSYADIDLRPINDYNSEADEGATLTLSAGSAYSRGAPSSATVTIRDDDFSNLISCPMTAGGGDGISRGFYVRYYPGNSLRDVYLYFSSATAGTYTFSLTARLDSYSGTLIGTSTASVALSGDTQDNRATGFSFPQNPSIAQGRLVTFAIRLTSGPSSSAYYATSTNRGCPVVQTNGTTPPLSTFRRDGIAVRIIGAPADYYDFY